VQQNMNSFVWCNSLNWLITGSDKSLYSHNGCRGRAVR